MLRLRKESLVFVRIMVLICVVKSMMMMGMMFGMMWCSRMCMLLVLSDWVVWVYVCLCMEIVVLCMMCDLVML